MRKNWILFFLLIPSIGRSQSTVVKTPCCMVDSVTADKRLIFITQFGFEGVVLTETVVIYKDKGGALCAEIKTKKWKKSDEKKKKIKLDPEMIKKIKDYECAVREQVLGWNVRKYVVASGLEGCLAQYDLVFGAERIHHESKVEWYSLANELLGIKE